MADLQDAFVFLGQLGEFFGFIVRECQRFFNKYVLAGFKKFFAERKMRLRGRDAIWFCRMWNRPPVGDYLYPGPAPPR